MLLGEEKTKSTAKKSKYISYGAIVIELLEGKEKVGNFKIRIILNKFWPGNFSFEKTFYRRGWKILHNTLHFKHYLKSKAEVTVTTKYFINRQ